MYMYSRRCENIFLEIKFQNCNVLNRLEKPTSFAGSNLINVVYMYIPIRLHTLLTFSAETKMPQIPKMF
jgi:hypothetical protein